MKLRRHLGVLGKKYGFICARSFLASFSKIKIMQLSGFHDLLSYANCCFSSSRPNYEKQYLTNYFINPHTLLFGVKRNEQFLWKYALPSLTKRNCSFTFPFSRAIPNRTGYKINAKIRSFIFYHRSDHQISIDIFYLKSNAIFFIP